MNLKSTHLAKYVLSWDRRRARIHFSKFVKWTTTKISADWKVFNETHNSTNSNFPFKKKEVENNSRFFFYYLLARKDAWLRENGVAGLYRNQGRSEKLRNSEKKWRTYPCLWTLWNCFLSREVKDIFWKLFVFICNQFCLET